VNHKEAAGLRSLGINSSWSFWHWNVTRGKADTYPWPWRYLS